MAMVEQDVHMSNTIRNNGELSFRLPVMTKQEIKRSALEHGGYSTPALNDQLYLHYKGFIKIENLEEYTYLKSLWLDSNGLQRIENISFLESLRCLFLQRNLLTKIENLSGLNSLVQLDLSENRLQRLENLSILPSLSSLNVSKNALVTVESIVHLSECKALSNVDLSNNKLTGEEIIDVLGSMKVLLSINLKGNPVASEITNFRKKVVSSVKTLKYLDRPIFELERATTEAWAKGGRDAELLMKENLLKKKQDEEKIATMNFRKWQEEVRKRAQQEKNISDVNEQNPKQVAKLETQSAEEDVFRINEAEIASIQESNTNLHDNTLSTIKSQTPKESSKITSQKIGCNSDTKEYDANTSIRPLKSFLAFSSENQRVNYQGTFNFAMDMFCNTYCQF